MTGVRRFAQWGLWFGGALVLLAALLIGIDVLMRKFLARSIGGADELAGYSLAIGTAWGLGAALLDRAHIRIDSLYMLFPRGLRLALDLAGLVLFLAFFGLIAWHGWGVVEQSWTSGSRSQSALETPTVIPQLLWIAGLLGFLAVGLVLLVHAARLMRSGDLRAVSQLIGTRSAEEEVEDEIRDLKERPNANGRPEMLGVTLAILIGLLALAMPVAAGLGSSACRCRRSIRSCRCRSPWARSPGARRTISCWSRSRSSCCSAKSCCAPAWRSACTTRWCCGCRGCPAG